MIWLALLPWLVLTGHTLVNARLLRRLPASGGVDGVPVDGGRPGAAEERIAVLLPLRDEAGRVTPCLEALLAQRGVPHLEIYVLDDGSTDGTAAVVRKVAGDRVRLLTGEPPPAGWLGKPYACHQLAAAARTADVLSFVDADVVLEPDALAAAATLLRRTGVTLLSPYPRITGAGRLVQPLEVMLPQAGAHQGQNAALAVAAAHVLSPRLSDTAIQTGLARVRWPGRPRAGGPGSRRRPTPHPAARRRPWWPRARPRCAPAAPGPPPARCGPARRRAGSRRRRCRPA